MHFLGEYYLHFDNFFFHFVQDTIISNCVAQITNKSKGGEERQVLDAQICAPTNSIPMDLIQIFFLPLTRYTVLFNL